VLTVYRSALVMRASNVTLSLVTVYALTDILEHTAMKLAPPVPGVLAASISALMIVFTLVNVTLLLGHVSAHLDSVERIAILHALLVNGVWTVLNLA